MDDLRVGKLYLSWSDRLIMKPTPLEIVFRYRSQDCASGVTRSTTQRLAKALGVGETQVIHLALRELAAKVLPQYEADEGPLTPAQCRQIKKTAPKARDGTIRSSLLDAEGA